MDREEPGFGKPAVRMDYETPFLMETIRKIEKGALAPAAFQRPYAWHTGDVEALFTSIVERWPIGGFLLWNPLPEDAERLSRGRLGPIETSGDRSTLVLDGQNRLATIAWALVAGTDAAIPDLGYSYTEIDTWVRNPDVLAADFETGSIRFMDASKASTGTSMPLGVLMNNSLFNRATRRREDPIGNEAIVWFDAMAAAIREARIVTSTIQDATVDEARRAFLHVARTGVPITAEDFDAAVQWVDAPEPRRP